MTTIAAIRAAAARARGPRPPHAAPLRPRPRRPRRPPGAGEGRVPPAHRQLQGAGRLGRRLGPARRARRGVLAYSSGNHAQGVARAAAAHGLPCVIVMPADAPRAKIDGTRALGAEVVLYDRRPRRPRRHRARPSPRRAASP